MAGAAGQRLEPGETGQRVEPRRVVLGLAQRVTQTPRGVGQPGVERERTEVGEQSPTVVAGSALLQRPLEIAGGEQRRARLPCVVGRADEVAGDLGVAVRAALEQVRGDGLGARVGIGEHARGLAVQALALGVREVLDERGGHQPVHEPQPVGREQAGGLQRVADRGELADRDAGQRGDDVQRRAVAEDGDRGGDRAVARRQGGEAAARRCRARRS